MSTLSAKLSRLGAPLTPGPVQAAPLRVEALKLTDRVHGPGYRQGRVEIGPARLAQASTVAALALDETLRGVDATGMLFVDTETTGLHGGAGTLPFVIGLAWFEGGLSKLQKNSSTTVSCE